MNRRTFFGWLLKVALAVPALPAILEAAAKIMPMNPLFSGNFGASKGVKFVNYLSPPPGPARELAKTEMKKWIAEVLDEEIFMEQWEGP